VSDETQVAAMISATLQAFGRLDYAFNYAAIIGDETPLAVYAHETWDRVIAVNLKGHAAPSRPAMAYWRAEAKADRTRAASIIHTTSSSGLCGNFGQANYGAAKMGVLGLSKVLAIEGAKYGVRSNVISPSARTRMTAVMTGTEALGEPDDTGYDAYGPEHIAAVVAWLAEAGCPANDQVFHVSGRRVRVLEAPRIAYEARSDADFTPETVAAALADHLVRPLEAFELILG